MDTERLPSPWARITGWGLGEGFAQYPGIFGYPGAWIKLLDQAPVASGRGGSRAPLELAPHPGCHRSSYCLLSGACRKHVDCSHPRRGDPLTGQLENARPELAGALLFPCYHLRRKDHLGQPEPGDCRAAALASGSCGIYTLPFHSSEK